MFKRKRKTYFVSYSILCDGGNGIGSIDITVDKEIKAYKDVKFVMDEIKRICEEKGQKNVQIVIINWIRLPGDDKEVKHV
jgi:hypothetical protein